MDNDTAETRPHSFINQAVANLDIGRQLVDSLPDHNPALVDINLYPYEIANVCLLSSIAYSLLAIQEALIAAVTATASSGSDVKVGTTPEPGDSLADESSELE